MKDNKDLWNQLCKLGEMIGDGLHHEEPWISKEYKRLQKILLPPTQQEKDYKKKATQLKNKHINEQIATLILRDKCKCGSNLKQTRSGSKVVQCIDESCKKKYRYKTGK